MRVAVVMIQTALVLGLFGASAGLSASAGFSVAQAQDDFDSEFDAEFEEEPPPSTDSVSDDASSDDEFSEDGFSDDGFSDDFADGASDDGSSSDDGFADDGFDDGASDSIEDTATDAATDAAADGAPEAGEDGDDAELTEEDLGRVVSEVGGEETRRDRRFRLHNTMFGPVGGLHVVDAGSGAVDSFRVSLLTDFFFTSDFLNEGDQHRHIGATLSLSWTPLPFLEASLAVSSYANFNDSGDPQLFQVLGDTYLGVKGFYEVLPWLTVGGDLTLALLNTVGDVGVVFRGTSLGLRANASADFRDFENPIPLIARFNFQYFMDNSYNLVDGVEDARYNNLTDPVVRRDETRHLLTRTERYGLNINRTDFFTLALGAEAPIQITDDFHIHPLLEWTWRIPVNRRSFSCLDERDMVAGTLPQGVDACLKFEKLAAFPMDLTLGARVLPPLEGLSILVAADIGLTGRGSRVRELAGNAPYTIYAGLSYAYDTEPTPEEITREVEREVQVDARPPLRGRIRGYVVEQGAGTPIDGAAVAFTGQDLSAVATDSQGRFISYALEPGEVRMGVSHPDYNAAGCVTVIPDERPEEGELVVDVRCELVARPRVGGARGQVLAADGTPIIAAQVRFTGTTNRNATTDASGNFQIDDLVGGSYEVRAVADGYLGAIQRIEISPRETRQLSFTVVQRPRVPTVTVSGRSINTRQRISFVGNTAEIRDQSLATLIELSDLMNQNPELGPVEIQAHTDNRGNSGRLEQLSQRRADAVRTWLVNNGVAPHRLTARGYGGSRPLVPNITSSNRARNNRIQFVIAE